jgi:pimeloyl-ACP methyl ester carboxylesterase
VRAVTADGTELYYERTGAGAPVLLVMGLGMNATGWWRTVPVLAERHEVIAFDNRGSGRSDVPDGPYTMEQLADDAAAVLDACGVDRAHVYGISLGGMIAQTIALRHPARVDRLVLGATTPGGERHVKADDDVLRFVSARGTMTAEQAAWGSVPINYSRRTRERHGQRIAEDVARRLEHPITGRGYGAQLPAAMGFKLGEQASAIAAPTLVVHGTEDVLVRPENGRLLAELIPGATLRLWPDAAHLYPTDEPAADREVLEFLTSAPSSPGPASPERP